MGETFPDTAPSVRPPQERLDSWKEIAAYLNRDVTTVQRWEKREGMPVYRHGHDKRGSRYAGPAGRDSGGENRRLVEEEQPEVVAPGDIASHPSATHTDGVPGSMRVWWVVAA